MKLSNFYLGRTFKILILNFEKNFSKNIFFSSSPFTLYTMRKNSLKIGLLNYVFLNQRNTFLNVNLQNTPVCKTGPSTTPPLIIRGDTHCFSPQRPWEQPHTFPVPLVLLNLLLVWFHTHLPQTQSCKSLRFARGPLDVFGDIWV